MWQGELLTSSTGEPGRFQETLKPCVVPAERRDPEPLALVVKRKNGNCLIA
jgi:hypothetical protein